MKESVSTSRLLLTIVSLLLLYGLVVAAGHAPLFVEQYYSQEIYPVIATATQAIFNFIPVSVGDLLYIATVLWLVVIAGKLLKRLFTKKFREAGRLVLKTLIGVQAGILVFYLFWGLNYFRPPAAVRLGLQDSCCSREDIRRVAAILIDSANAVKLRLKPSDLQQDNRQIFGNAVAAMKALGSHDARFKTYFPTVKPSMLTFFMNYMGTAGYYNPFTSEAQLNYEMPVYTRPVVACHEMSHQIGFNAEDEANFGGFLAGVSSDERLLKYSAYYMGMQEFMAELRNRDTTAFNELKPCISPAVIEDLKAEREYWRRFRGKAGILSSLMYEQYLKINNQPEGLQTYNRMVKLVIAWYKRNRPGH
ncbi:DUF3810 domain-containing protein [Hufsiella ginkgonis]|uniref:DUF3810 family protein n=1 Tax=Hufsiella ginkgonis TaxID=2695274 RepID=A0A7K1XZ31_9SPHI|nr:DUF3810 domain-containing protein [Hufsiella ginkgonis]MXV16261.1 DUF3810 family protein [Hufsiella ginkgonis]